MVRQASRHDEQSIDAHRVAVAEIARCELLGGGCDAFQAVSVERDSGGVGSSARLHLDEGERPAAAGDYIDLTAACPRPPGEDSPAVQAQIPAGDGFSASSAPFGEVTVPGRVHFDRSRARAYARLRGTPSSSATCA